MRTFQLTSSRGGWRLFRAYKLIRTYFNSHPHEEDDERRIEVHRRTNISTHILTRRMTQCVKHFFTAQLFQLTSSRGGWRSTSLWTFSIREISTHILTRRMTTFSLSTLPKYIISTHILTRRMTANHTAVDNQIYISTHILTRRMTPFFLAFSVALL